MNRDAHGWLRRRPRVRVLMQRLAPGALRGWQWRSPGQVISPRGRVFDVRLQGGLHLRPATKKEAA